MPNQNAKAGDAKAGEAGAGDTGQFVSFEVGGEEFGIDILTAKEIIRPVETTPLPGAPDFMEGVINLRGELVPIIDLRERLLRKRPLGERPLQERPGFPKQEVSRQEASKQESGQKRGGDTRILVVELEGRAVGLVTDSVSEVLQVEESAVEPAPGLASEAGTRLLRGVAKLEERLLILLDPEGIFSPEEAEALRRIEDSPETGNPETGNPETESKPEETGAPGRQAALA